MSLSAPKTFPRLAGGESPPRVESPSQKDSSTRAPRRGGDEETARARERSARERSRARRASFLSRRALLLSAALLLLWPPAAYLAARALVVRAELERADVLVVLGGASDYHERARHAAQLFREGRAPLVVLTDDGARGGWSQAEQRNPSFCELSRAELLAAGVPPASVRVLPGAVDGTHSEALLLRRHADANNWRSLLVVTSPYHSRRALWTFRRAFGASGARVGVAPTPFAQTPPPAAWWLSARGWRSVAPEYPKQVYYWLAY